MAGWFYLSICALFIYGTSMCYGFTCYSCKHEVYSSSDSSLTSHLSSISENDADCKYEYNSNSDTHLLCTTSCYFEVGTAVLTYQGKSVNYEIAQRGCSSYTRTGTCNTLTVDTAVALESMSVVSENVYGCYCDTNNCNNACSCQADNDGNSLKQGPGTFLILAAMATMQIVMLY